MSIPQVASYSLILKDMISVPDAKIMCVTFNKHNAWEYSPDILLSDVKRIIAELKPKHPTLDPFGNGTFNPTLLRSCIKTIFFLNSFVKNK